MHMTVGFDAGAWRVVARSSDPVLAGNLALLQQQYAGRDAAIRVIGDLGTGNTLALVTEGGREALIVLSDVRSPLPEWRESPLQALPPDQVMRKLLAEACPPGMTC